MKCLIGWHNYQ